ncbi:MAG: hypothetical protein DRI65_13580 [Chloroflexota bacterium]|nr:MAG: hypothetical protein DRI65_13580 [Chloroflexota bacterium]
MKLVYDKTGEEVKVGDMVKLRDGEEVEVTLIEKPHKPSSTGRVYVKAIFDLQQRGYFPSVIGTTWIEREDH